ncbi:MAG: cation:dicarboxylase symporter family transporter, partial [Planctomycetota bacterium]
MQQHWKILTWLVAGVFVGVLFQQLTESPGSLGVTFKSPASQSDTVGEATGVSVARVTKSLLPKGRSGSEALKPGDQIIEIVINAGMADENGATPANVTELEEFLARAGAGGVATIELASGEMRSSLVVLDPISNRARWLAPFIFMADIFMRLLKMLIMPLVFTSIVTGVAGLGGGSDFGRMGRRTFGY